MHIIIPMSGVGRRFIEAGYRTPKPLIEIDGKPIIEHVVSLFPGEEKITFICNSTHLEKTNMREILQGIAPKGNICEIPPHKKGPVYAVMQLAEQIDDDDECIVNYCDFGTYWSYENFLKHTRTRRADGALPSYKGFHPHMLGTTNYAFIRDENQWMLEIQEKKPFTNNRMQEYASNGTYYFRTGKILKENFQELMNLDLDLKGEYYVSMVYNLLLKKQMKVSIFEIQHMLQWGIPEDVEEYNRWSNYFKAIVNSSEPINVIDSSVNLIPLAGQGSRFVKEGYTNPKPLILVSGKPMIVQASEYLPNAQKRIFVCLGEHLDTYSLKEEIIKTYADADLIRIDRVTEGQAITCEIGLEGIDDHASVLISACDHGMLWSKKEYADLLNDESIDAIVWSFREHPSAERNPEMYGWLKTDENNIVTGVSVKKAISDNPRNDHAIVGTFYFRKKSIYDQGLSALKKNDNRVNSEFYVDSLIEEIVNQGFKVKVFSIDHYICWGTPNDYETFCYWQSLFHKVDWHPYSLEKDPTVESSAIRELEESFYKFEQENE